MVPFENGAQGGILPLVVQEGAASRVRGGTTGPGRRTPSGKATTTTTAKQKEKEQSSRLGETNNCCCHRCQSQTKTQKPHSTADRVEIEESRGDTCLWTRYQAHVQVRGNRKVRWSDSVHDRRRKTRLSILPQAKQTNLVLVLSSEPNGRPNRTRPD